VAKSVTRHGNDTHRAEAIDVAVPRGQYYVAINVESEPGAGESSTLQLFSPRAPLQYASGQGGVAAPATSDRVISVTAVEASGRAKYASWTDEGVRVDLGAPGTVETAVSGRFVGTSAAAPYVAGTAALMQANNANLTPDDIQRILEATASEDGRVDALAAVQAVSTETPLAFDNSTTPESINENATAGNVTLVNATAGNTTLEDATAGNVTLDNATAGTAEGGGNASNGTSTAADGPALGPDDDSETTQQNQTRDGQTAGGDGVAAAPARRRPA
jgi:hypothetical protein